jgi:hypothetical protein
MRGAQSDAGPVGQPQAAAFRLLLWDLETFTAPDPLHPLIVHQPAGIAQQRRDLPVAIAAVLPGKCDDVGGEPLLVVAALRRLALRRTVLAERRTGATLGYAKLNANMIDTGAATRRAQ